MNKAYHLLVCLNEECAEVQKEISKALRFGLKDVYIKHPEWGNNKKRIETEIKDILGVVVMLQQARVLENFDPNDLHKHINAKRAKLKKYMRIARKNKMLV